MEIENEIRDALSEGFQAEILDVVNESHQHSVPKNSETHFRVLLVSSEFEGENRIARHRRVHRALQKQLQNGVHALAIDAWTPQEWESNDQRPTLSPRCLGGSKR